MSTRRTYEAVTRGLKAAMRPSRPMNDDHNIAVEDAAEHVADELAKDHPGFDRERFLRDAGAKS
jgi:hypothetical protein